MIATFGADAAMRAESLSARFRPRRPPRSRLRPRGARELHVGRSRGHRARRREWSSRKGTAAKRSSGGTGCACLLRLGFTRQWIRSSTRTISRSASAKPMALDRLTLTVGPGEVFGFLGPNGAGKTTTVRLLLGIIRASEGSSTCSAATRGRTPSPCIAACRVRSGRAQSVASAHRRRDARVARRVARARRRCDTATSCANGSCSIRRRRSGPTRRGTVRRSGSSPRS